MAKTCYCSKCGCEVPAGQSCPQCGARIRQSGTHLNWEVPHMPAKDWMCWNAVMRLTIPVLAALLMMILTLQGLSAGVQGVETMLMGPLLPVLAGLSAMLVPVLWLILLLQGEDVLICTVDGQGVHLWVMLPQPTKIKLLLRLKSPTLMDQADADGRVLVQKTDLKWKDVRRVQLWQEKLLILFYAPARWMRLALPCSAFTWEETLQFITEKIGKKKTVILPEILKAAPTVKTSARKPRTRQVTLEDAWQSAPDPWDSPFGENTAQDAAPLEDVLAEVREKSE